MNGENGPYRIVDRITAYCRRAAEYRHGHAFEDRCKVGQAVKARARLSAQQWREQQAKPVNVVPIRRRRA